MHELEKKENHKEMKYGFPLFAWELVYLVLDKFNETYASKYIYETQQNVPVKNILWKTKWCRTLR